MLTLVTAPVSEPITLAELKAQLRIDHADEDAYLTSLIEAARLTIEAQTSRALVTQTWMLTLDRFPECNNVSGRDSIIRLPKPPLQSVSSIVYLDDSGTQQTLPTTVYQMNAPAGQTPPKGDISLKYGQTWPVTQAVKGAVKITFLAGWAEVPETLKLTCKGLAAWYYEQPTPVNIGNIVTDLPMHIDNLLKLYKVREF